MAPKTVHTADKSDEAAKKSQLVTEPGTSETNVPATDKKVEPASDRKVESAADEKVEPAADKKVEAAAASDSTDQKTNTGSKKETTTADDDSTEVVEAGKKQEGSADESKAAADATATSSADSQKQKLRTDYRKLENSIAEKKLEIEKISEKYKMAKKKAAEDEHSKNASDEKESEAQLETGAKQVEEEAGSSKQPTELDIIRSDLDQKKSELETLKKQSTKVIRDLESVVYPSRIYRVVWYRGVGRLAIGTVNLGYNTIVGVATTIYNIGGNGLSSAWSLIKSAVTRTGQGASQIIASYTNQYKEYQLLEANLTGSVKSNILSNEAPKGLPEKAPAEQSDVKEEQHDAKEVQHDAKEEQHGASSTGSVQVSA